jgi:hypothetical protein
MSPTRRPRHGDDGAHGRSYAVTPRQVDHALEAEPRREKWLEDLVLASAGSAALPVFYEPDANDSVFPASITMKDPARAVLSVVHVTDGGEHVPARPGVVDGSAPAHDGSRRNSGGHGVTGHHGGMKGGFGVGAGLPAR